MMNFETPRLSSFTRNIKIYLPIAIIIGGLFLYFNSVRKEKKYRSDYEIIFKLYSGGKYQTAADLATKFLEDYDKESIEGLSIMKLRGASFLKLHKYGQALLDIDHVTNINGKDSYYLYFHRALLNHLLSNTDTLLICNDVTTAINSKGRIISNRKLKLDYVDTTDVWDVN